MTSFDTDSTRPPPNIPEFASFEHQKENIVPLRQGRSAALLAHQFSAPSSDLSAERASVHAHFADELAHLDDLDDPLDVFSRYIRWTLEAYPQGPNHESNLVPLLEQVTRKFKNERRYKNDPRYLRCWLLYANYVEEPKDIFVFLMRNDIGTDLAALYEDYALLLEKMGRSDQADEMYALGIARSAAPLERLKRHQQQFKARAMQRALQQHDDFSPTRTPAGAGAIADPTRPLESGDSTRRTILGHKSSASSTRSASMNEFAARNPGVIAESMGGARRSNNNKMAVFVDPDGSAARREAEREGQMESGGAPWADLGTERYRKKENVREGTAWAGQTLSQKGGTRGPVGGEKIEVYVDQPDPSVAPPDRSSPQPAGLVLRAAAKPSETELLKKNPLKNFDPEPDPRAASAPAADSSTRQPARAVKPSSRTKTPAAPAPAGEKQERLAVDLSLVYINGEEFCFEEIRAKERRYCQWEEEEVVRNGARSAKRMDVEVEDDDDKEEMVQGRGVDSLPRTPVKEFSTFVSPKPRAIPSPTINTKAALADIMEIFSQPLKCERSDSDSDFDDVGHHHHGRPPQQQRPSIPIYRDENDLVSATTRQQGDENAGPSQRKPLTEKERPKLMQVTDENAPMGFAFQEINEFQPQVQARTPLGNKVVPPTKKMQVYADDNDEEEEGNLQHQQAPPSSAARDARSFDVYRDALGDGFERKTVMQSTPHNLFADPTSSSYDDDEDDNSDSMMYDEPLRDTPGTAYRQQQQRAHYAFDPLTPITERSGEFTLSAFDRSMMSGHNTFHGTSLGIAEGYTIPGIDTAAFNASVIISGGATTGSRGTPSPRRVVERDGSRSPIAARPTVLVTTNPCKPMDPRFINATLAALDPPLRNYPGFHDYGGETVAALARAERAVAARRASAKKGDAEEFVLKLGGESYGVRRKIGEGGFAKVFLVHDLNVRNEIEDVALDLDLDDDNTVSVEEESPFRALKIETPPAAWEFYILRQLHTRLPPRLAASSIVVPRALHVFSDESHLVLEYGDQGTLLDAVNGFGRDPTLASAAAPMDEILAMFFTVELLRVVDAMHSARILHGDIKPDNCLLRLQDSRGRWDAQYDPDGAGGWASKGIRVIDFGRAIDLSLFPSGMEFLADWEVDKYDCPEMRAGQPWSFQADYWGVAGVAHVLLHGRYIEVVEDPARDGWYRPAAAWKRYWQGGLWGRLFDVLLNPRRVAGGRVDVTLELRSLRKEMEVWLVENGNRGGRSLKGLVRKLEIAVLEGRGRA